MKIALVIEQMDPYRGGREVSTSQIASGLARRGHEVTVLCRRADWRCDGVRVQELGARGLFRTRRFRNFAADVGRWLLLHPQDAVHAVAPVPGATFYQPRGGTMPGQEASRLERSPGLAFRRRLLGPLNSYRRMLADLERQLVSDPRVTCLAISRMVAEEFRLHYGRTQDVRVIYNGVDVPQATPQQRQEWRLRRRQTLGVSPGDLLFLTVARNFGLKGVNEAMGHFLRWCDTRDGVANARLVVVGRALPSPLHPSSRIREISRRIPMVGWTPDIFEWYSAADACVLLSWYDACSRVVLEAVRWGLPCITTGRNGAAEVLAAGGGIVVESPRDSQGVLGALDAMRDPARRAEFSGACLRAGDLLSMDRHVEQLLEAYAARTAAGQRSSGNPAPGI